MATPAAINAVVTSFRVIEHLSAAGKPLGVSELARRMNTGRALVFRHLKTLVDLGYANQNPDTEKYILTSQFIRLGQLVSEQITFAYAARKVMLELSTKVNLTVSAGQLEPEGIRVVEIIRNRSKVEISTPIGTLFDYACSAQGRAALAFMPDGSDAVLSHECKTGREKITEQSMAVIRQRGWSASSDEVLVGISAIAAPVFNFDGTVAGTLALVGSSKLLPPTPDPKIIEALLCAAQQASELLGFGKNEEERETA